MNEKFVVLLRHGIAEAHGSKPDEQRELTDEGRRRIEEIAMRLAEVFPDVDTILSSPLIRATQTAEPLARAYRMKVKLAPELRSGADASAARELIERTSGKRIICIGHEPGLSELMLMITRMQCDGEIALKKGGCYGIRMNDGAGQLEWMLPPRVLRG
jgi:phosphohistidine phosphatase